MSAVLHAAPVLEPMRPEDLDAVLAIEQSAYPFPWTRANFADALAAGYLACCCRSDGALIGHAVMLLVLDEAHLLNLTLAPEWQGRGCGRQVMDRLLGEARGRGARRMFLEVRPSNAAALALYGRLGFAQIGRRRGYYPAEDGREDALVMALDL